jgi:hypothetical protein
MPPMATGFRNRFMPPNPTTARGVGCEHGQRRGVLFHGSALLTLLDEAEPRQGEEFAPANRPAIWRASLRTTAKVLQLFFCEAFTPPQTTPWPSLFIHPEVAAVPPALQCAPLQLSMIFWPYARVTVLARAVFSTMK